MRSPSEVTKSRREATTSGRSPGCRPRSFARTPCGLASRWSGPASTRWSAIGWPGLVLPSRPVGARHSREEGFAYDSSLRPLGAGWAGKSEQRRVFRHPAAAGDIWEFPISSWQFAGFCLPISGGNYVRQLPHGWIRRRIESWDRTSPAPLIFYFHVWELDPALPQINAASRLSKIRQYRNLDVMTQRLRHYLGSFSYQTVTDYLAADPRSSDLAAPLPGAEPSCQRAAPRAPAP